VQWGGWRRRFDRGGYTCLAPSSFVRRSQIGERGKQVFVGLWSILDHLAVCEDRQKSVARVVGECPPIGRKGCGAGRVFAVDFPLKAQIAE
jgi:hypothetical protein